MACKKARKARQSYTDTELRIIHEKNQAKYFSNNWNRGQQKCHPTKKKIDIAEAFRLRVLNKLTLQEIADRFKCHKSSVSKALKRFIAILPDTGEIQAYLDNKSHLLTAVELTLLSELANPEKLKAASLNNLAYSFQNIHNANRLEAGKSTTNAACVISIEHRQLAQKVIDGIIKIEIEKIA